MKRIDVEWMDKYLKKHEWTLESTEKEEELYFDADELYHKHNYRISLRDVVDMLDEEDGLPNMEVYELSTVWNIGRDDTTHCLFNGTVYDKTFLEQVFKSIGVDN